MNAKNMATFKCPRRTPNCPHVQGRLRGPKKTARENESRYKSHYSICQYSPQNRPRSRFGDKRAIRSVKEVKCEGELRGGDTPKSRARDRVSGAPKNSPITETAELPSLPRKFRCRV